ncbi:hypothetical protein E4516_22460 [Escherichia coli]|uniref:hypothetical protein n=1 Tax=Escherichia coli TaxID=562 RepID=UPI001FA9CD4B|nr:hypothetical protein [Escherichia coli]MCI5376971.1 hypothetical protein [Escherichia coli]
MHYRCLLLPLLVVLSGCSTTPRTPDTPAASFVSTLITVHAEKIRALQKDPLSQATPSPRPASSSARTAQQHLPGVTLVGKRPVLLPLTQQRGRQVPLTTALKRILPPGWQPHLMPRVASRLPVSWAGNDQWPYVLQKIAREHQLKMTIDFDRHTVTVSPAGADFL